MNNTKLRLWIDALRSGEFEQGKSYLNRNGKMCCLGVLCEVAIRNGVDVKKFRDPDFGDIVGYDGCVTTPPSSVTQWISDGEEWPHAPKVLVDGYGKELNWVGDKRESVIALNDNASWTFAQIADALEGTFLNEPVAA